MKKKYIIVFLIFLISILLPLYLIFNFTNIFRGYELAIDGVIISKTLLSIYLIHSCSRIVSLFLFNEK